MTSRTETKRFSSVYTPIMGAVVSCIEISLGGQPLDRLKTHLQRDPSLSTKGALQSIWRQEGVKGFYKGFRWNLVQAGTKGAFRWGANATCDYLYTSLVPLETRKRHPLLFTSAIALSAATLDATVLNLTDRVKIFEMTSRDRRETWARIRARGPSFFFDGWGRSCAKQMSIWMTYQLSYQLLKQRIERENDGKKVSW